MTNLYEKLGLFYLGRDIDKETQEASDALTLLKNKNFTTHAAIIGMTGSGKTGLGIGLIEEAAIDNIPSILIDPKGDMGNLLLTDPTFNPKNFEPWVKDEAQNKNEDVATYAAKIATMWQKGIKRDHQDETRVAKLHKVEKTIYTPGSSSGISLNILGSLQAPPQEVLNDADTFASYLKSTVSSLLSLIKIEADPVSSKEYLLIAQILANKWTAGENLSLEELIGAVIAPYFDKIGVLPLESFYPQDKRFSLATKFNAIIASPTFSAWLQGEDLDIQKLLYDENGKAKIAILSIAHLSDEERMFFVTILLNKYIAWMRRQSGTSALKAILYMDEIYGYFPPSKNPPSKEPMMLLLKQARAFGTGVVLSTQNPVDLDYKGLSNIGTWFIGRLQTSQDIERVIDGLGGKVGASYSKSEIKELLANLQKRTFFLKSAHLDDIRVFSTRWV
ncbi:MAG TPA: ATP-binding protein, partial [Campylobacterales bacterium]|nr:ATP-binding protein [Campylobacterales bacterium]